MARYEKRNQQAQWIVQSGDVDSRPVWAHGLRGQGQLVSVLRWMARSVIKAPPWFYVGVKTGREQLDRS